MKNNNKYLSRTRFLIFPRFQLVLLGANLAIMLVVSLITWMSVTHAFTSMAPAAGLDNMETEFYKKYIAYQTSTMQWQLLTSLVLGIVVSTLVTLYISHRFSGPLVRLRNYFEGIATSSSSDVPKLSFRQGDFLDDIPPVVNRAIEKIQRSGQDSKSARKNVA